MALKIQKPNVYDNTDGDLIIINKSKLSNHLHLIRRAVTSSSSVLGWLGLSAAFIIPALLAQEYTGIGPINSDVIKALLLMLGVVCFVAFVYTFIIWYQTRGKHDPDKLVAELLQENPMPLKTILYQLDESKKSKANKNEG